MTYISVIIPTFNKASLVCDIVRNLNKQTFKDFEVLVVDDGSSDGTTKKLKKMRREERHLKIKVLQTGLTNIFGMCHAINMGLREASGPITFLQNDDIYLHPTCLEQHFAAQMHLEMKHALIGPRFYCPPHELGVAVRDHETRRRQLTKYTERGTSFKGCPVYRKRMMVSSNLSINTQKLCDIGGYNEYFTRYTGAIDRDLYYRLTLVKMKVLFIYHAQAYAIRYNHPQYRATDWVQDVKLHNGVSIEDWKREQMRYSEKMELRARENPPPPIVRRKS